MKINQGDKSKLNDQQLEAIKLIALPDQGGLTFEEIAEKVGVSVRTIHRWRLQDDFKRVLLNVSLDNVQYELPRIYAALIRSAEKGNVKAAELLLKSHSLLSDKSEIEVIDSRDQHRNEVMDDIKRMTAELKELGIEDPFGKGNIVQFSKAKAN